MIVIEQRQDRASPLLRLRQDKKKRTVAGRQRTAHARRGLDKTLVISQRPDGEVLHDIWLRLTIRRRPSIRWPNARTGETLRLMRAVSQSGCADGQLVR